MPHAPTREILIGDSAADAIKRHQPYIDHVYRVQYTPERTGQTWIDPATANASRSPTRSHHLSEAFMQEPLVLRHARRVAAQAGPVAAGAWRSTIRSSSASARHVAAPRGRQSGSHRRRRRSSGWNCNAREIQTVELRRRRRDRDARPLQQAPSSLVSAWESLASVTTGQSRPDISWSELNVDSKWSFDRNADPRIPPVCWRSTPGLQTLQHHGVWPGEAGHAHASTPGRRHRPCPAWRAWLITTAGRGCARRACDHGKVARLQSASKRSPCSRIAASAGRTPGRRIQSVSSISCRIGRRPFSSGARQVRRRGGAPGPRGSSSRPRPAPARPRRARRRA